MVRKRRLNDGMTQLAAHSERMKISTLMVSDFVRRNVEDPKELVILLHGYMQAGISIFKKLEPAVPKEFEVLAPCGPFPIPEETPDGHRMGYSWYFYDPSTDEYFIDMEVGLQMLERLLEKLHFSHLPVRIIGFSQGGYLAPFLGLRMEKTTQVIGLSCRFVDEEIPTSLPFSIAAVHGELDEVTPLEPARGSFEQFIKRGSRGRFISVPSAGHRIDQNIVREVGLLLRENFRETP